jgi:hypothetical protein
LSEEFAQELEQALDVLLRQPGMGSKRYAYLLAGNALRFWSLDRFPFLVFYRVLSESCKCCVSCMSGAIFQLLGWCIDTRNFIKYVCSPIKYCVSSSNKNSN